MVLLYNKTVVGVIELKTLMGPSFGNNIKERNTEAFGNTFDLIKTIESDLFSANKPFIGYLMIMEDNEKNE